MIQLRPSMGVSALVNFVRQFYDAGPGVTQTSMLGVTGAAPALVEDFTTGQSLDPRITFSRTSNATVTDSTGTLVYAPHNLLTYSEQFDNAAWGKNAVTISANAIAAPDGTTTADKIQETAVTNYFAVTINPTASYSTTYTWSCYAKAAERNFLALNFSVAGVSGTFNLTTGVNNMAGTGFVSAAATNVGSGWWRLSVVLTTPASGSNVLYHVFGPSINNSIAAYAGTAGSGIYLWGAQLNVGSLQPYYTTTVKNLLGYTQEFDNAAWTKINSFVQTNQIRNNTGQGAVAGTPGTLPTNWSTFTSLTGLTRQVVGSGIENGVNYIDIRVSGTPSGAGDYGIYLDTSTGIAAATGQTWTQSGFLSTTAGTQTGISSITFRVDENTSGGAFVSNKTSSALSVTSTSTRFTATYTLSGGATVACIFPWVRLALSGAAIDITLRIGLPQLVLGASAGDVTATYGTARAIMYSAPDGSVTADKLVENTANAPHYLENTAVTTTSGTVYRASWYAKAAERSFVSVYLVDSGIVANTPSVFNLSTGTVTSGTQATITSVGNGWYRCSVFGVIASTSARVRIFIGDSTVSGYQGDGTSGVYIWGAQLSDSASLDSYVYNPVAAPSAAAYYGPRFDYDPVTLAPKGLLIEEQRTNLALYSDQFDNATWVYGTSCTYTPNALVSPDGSQTADLYTIGSTVNGTYQSVTVTASTAYTFSFYVRLGTVSATNFLLAVYNNTGAAFIASDVVPTQTPTASGWTRITYSFTTPVGCTSVRVYPFRNTAISSGTFYLWGAQLEAGAFATSYIPTTTASATRAADVATMVGANFSNWYNQSEGSVFVEASRIGSIASQNVWNINDGSFNNQITAFFTLGNDYRLDVAVGGVSQAAIVGANSTVLNQPVKSASAYKTNDFAISVNSAAAATDTSGSVPVTSRLSIGANAAASTFFNGYIRKIAYYNRRLANSELQAITA